jgi:hypothetical protein
VPTGVDCVTDAVGRVGALGDGVLGLPVPDSLPHPVSTKLAMTVAAAYLLRFLTHHGYT